MIKSLLKEKILVLDGAMGTMVQSYNLSEKDFRGNQFRNISTDLKGNNDILCLTQPQIIKEIHCSYFKAGADIVETNTFNANCISQLDYGLESLVYEINVSAAEIAKSSSLEFSDKPRFVAGALGPTNRTASMSPDVSNPGYRNILFDDLVSAYSEQARGLMDGGVDLFLVETIFDTLNCKAAIFALLNLFEDRKKEIPIFLSGTITDASGRTLSGQTVEAFWYSVRHANPVAIGLNCALGAKEIRPWLSELSKIADIPVFIYPNAGLPNEMGEYDDTPEEMANLLDEFARDGLVNIVGGCCGTTPDHISAISNAVKNIKPRQMPAIEPFTKLSGLEPVTIRPDSNFINIGERTNITGSSKFKSLILKEQYEEALSVARHQIENGAQILDINMDEGLLDSRSAMETFLRLIATEPAIAKIPIMVDSSKWSILETGLKNIQGKGIVNSISLKEGKDEFIFQAKQILKYGAAVIVMAFDERGQADTYEQKIEICTRAYDILVNQVGFQPEDIIFDPNIFAIATGIEEHNEYGKSFIEATKKIKEKFPKIKKNKDALRILFMNMSGYFSENSDSQERVLMEPPLGLIALLSYLNREYKEKINGKIVKSRMNFDGYDEMIKTIKDFNPDIIGISVMTFYKNFVHRSLKYIREKGIKTPIFLGGPYPTGDYESVLQDENVDICMLGEGELTLTDLVGQMIKNNNKLPTYEKLKLIPGIAFQNKRIELQI